MNKILIGALVPLASLAIVAGFHDWNGGENGREPAAPPSSEESYENAYRSRVQMQGRLSILEKDLAMVEEWVEESSAVVEEEEPDPNDGSAVGPVIDLEKIKRRVEVLEFRAWEAEEILRSTSLDDRISWSRTRVSIENEIEQLENGYHYVLVDLGVLGDS